MINSLSKYFTGIGAKRLSQVEIKPAKSNQHEFNGTNEFREIFGNDKKTFKGRFIFLSDDESKIKDDEGILTWYDARERHPTRTEYRLYYSTNDVIETASVNDLVIIGQTKPEELIVIVAEGGSTSEHQLLWLFGLEEVHSKFIIKDFSEDKQELGFAAKYIMSSLGFETEESAPDYLDLIFKTFGEKFPSTFQFSEFARSTIKEVSPAEAPDEALMLFIEREEMLFKTLEKHFVQNKLKVGFGKDGNDVDEFIQFSLSIQNRRKSRAGLAFENQLAYIFDSCKVHYTKKGKTERNNEPDFLFPGIHKYRDLNFDSKLLTMLGVKTTVKDRWRQVLSEADRIWPKHIITLEPSISKNQTDEMIAQNLRLVLPKGLISTYSPNQQKDIISFIDFIKLVRSKQG